MRNQPVSFRGGAFACALVGVLAACGSQESAPGSAPSQAPARSTAAPAAAPAPSAAAEAEAIFSTRCAVCHGPEGRGDGPGSAGLAPPPRNFGDPEWQREVSDEHIEKIIVYGGAAVGRSPTMPGNPDLMAKAEVVAALRQHIRGLAPR